MATESPTAATPISLTRMCKYSLDWEPLHGRSGHEVGRLLLERLYRAHTGKTLPEIRIAERGKPYFPEGHLHFSISHTKGHAFCVLSDRPVGIDAEEMDRDVKLKNAEKILSPTEMERFLSADDKRSALLRLWVLKEASVKLTGEGLRGYRIPTDFDPDDPRILEIDGCYVAILTDKGENHAL